MAAIGMMDGAFFVGRKEIIDWINATLEISVQKVEDTASGAIACQLLDIMYPGQVPIHKVNWSAKQDFEFVANYKILQTAFTKLHIDKFIDVDRLISGRYMDNLEFMQWFKRFFEMSVQDKGDYDCALQRGKGRGGSSYQFAGKAKSSSVSSAPTKPKAPTTTKLANKSSLRSPAKATQKENKAPPAAEPTSRKPSAISEDSRSKPTKTGGINTAQAPVETVFQQAESATLKTQNEEQAKQLSELRLEMDGLEKERDFYFDKLRDIEVLLQEIEDSGRGNEVTASIFKILYATADGFEASAAVEEVEAVSEEVTETF